MRVETFKLQANESFKFREAAFQIATSPDSRLMIAIMQIDECRKLGNKVYTRRYAVCELPPTEDGRRFKVTKPTDEDPYYVFIGKSNLRHICDCRGWSSGRYCVHVESLAAFTEWDNSNRPEAHIGAQGNGSESQ